MIKNLLGKLLITFGILFSVATPVLADNHGVTIKIPVESDYDDVILEGEGLSLEIKNEIELSYTQLGNYEYEIYRKEVPGDKYRLQVIVLNNDSGKMVAEAVLSKNDDAQKYTKIEFKKDKEEPSESPSNVPSKNKNEIGTGVTNNFMMSAIIAIAALATGLFVAFKLKSSN